MKKKGKHQKWNKNKTPKPNGQYLNKKISILWKTQYLNKKFTIPKTVYKKFEYLVSVTEFFTL